MARRQGWSQQTLDALQGFEHLPEIDEATRVALRFAERMTLDANGIEDELFAALRSHYDEGSIVELAAVIGTFNYFNRFNNAFQMQPTQPGER